MIQFLIYSKRLIKTRLWEDNQDSLLVLTKNNEDLTDGGEPTTASKMKERLVINVEETAWCMDALDLLR